MFNIRTVEGARGVIRFFYGFVWCFVFFWNSGIFFVLLSAVCGENVSRWMHGWRLWHAPATQIFPP